MAEAIGAGATAVEFGVIIKSPSDKTAGVLGDDYPLASTI